METLERDKYEVVTPYIQESSWMFPIIDTSVESMQEERPIHFYNPDGLDFADYLGVSSDCAWYKCAHRDAGIPHGHVFHSTEIDLTGSSPAPIQSLEFLAWVLRVWNQEKCLYRQHTFRYDFIDTFIAFVRRHADFEESMTLYELEYMQQSNASDLTPTVYSGI